MFDPIVLPTLSQTHLYRARTRFDDGDVLAVVGLLVARDTLGPQAIAFDEWGRSALLVTRRQHGWCLGGESPEATRLLAAHMWQQQTGSSYLHAKARLADVFVEEWLQQGGQTDGLAYRFNMMVFNPDVVRPTTPAVDGYPEVATKQDLPELAAHAVGFYRGALTETRTVESQIERLRPLITAGHVHLWRNSNGQIASQAECTSLSFNSASVGYVHTPEQCRGRGYAGALVGHLSRRLAEKRLRVTLFADSKAGSVVRLYEKTGYETKAHIHRYDALRIPS